MERAQDDGRNRLRMTRLLVCKENNRQVPVVCSVQDFLQYSSEFFFVYQPVSWCCLTLFVDDEYCRCCTDVKLCRASRYRVLRAVQSFAVLSVLLPQVVLKPILAQDHKSGFRFHKAGL